MIYIDVSQLSNWLTRGRHLTGIQRLTFNCVAGLLRIVGSDNLRVIQFDSATNGFKAARAELLLCRTAAGGAWQEPIFETPQFGSGDQILLTEWIFSDRISTALFELAKRVDAKIFQFVHDCIPLARPDMFRKYLVDDFRKKMSKAIAHADVVLTNSEYSKHDIERFFGAELADGKEIRVVKLPHEFVPSEFETLNGFVREQDSAILNIPPALLKGPLVLMVGTLEERKNSTLAVRLWKKLQCKHGEATPVLVMVGSYGWHKLSLMASVFIGRFFSKSVYHLSRCNDETLHELYRRSLFTIYLSSYEGWGLPVGESMWLGTPVLSSNLTALPEVGEDLVDYVDPKDEAATMKAIERLCFDVEYRQQRAAGLTHEKLRSMKSFSEALHKAMIA
jgi:glycosyltransferase involved in cell wall biosynthesis